MTETRVAYRYAKALIDSAADTTALETLRADLDKLAAELKQSHELRVFFHSPVIGRAKKTSLIHLLFDGKLSPAMMQFLVFLCVKRREGIFMNIADEFLQLYDEKLGNVRPSISSAVELSDGQKQKLTAQLSAQLKKKVFPVYSVNPALRGGLVVQIDDTIIDGSVAHQLEMLRSQLNARRN